MQAVETIYGRLGGAAKRLGADGQHNEPAAQQNSDGTYMKGRSLMCRHGEEAGKCNLCYDEDYSKKPVSAAPTPALRHNNLVAIANDKSVNNFARSICGEAAIYINRIEHENTALREALRKASTALNNARADIDHALWPTGGWAQETKK